MGAGRVGAPLKVRGPFPGLGAVLRAFGLSRGLFVAQALQEKLERMPILGPLSMRLSETLAQFFLPNFTRTLGNFPLHGPDSLTNVANISN